MTIWMLLLGIVVLSVVTFFLKEVVSIWGVLMEKDICRIKGT